MSKDLTVEKEDENKNRDWCTDEMNTNEQETVAKTRDMNTLVAKVDDLTEIVRMLTKDNDKQKREIEDMHFQMKRAGEDRERAARRRLLVAERRARRLLRGEREVATPRLAGGWLDSGEFFAAAPRPPTRTRARPRASKAATAPSSASSAFLLPRNQKAVGQKWPGAWPILHC